MKPKLTIKKKEFKISPKKNPPKTKGSRYV